jgi:pimeloyl-ACP methyl ester carboxylesterase
MAQAFFSRYRERVGQLVLLSTGAPDRRRGVLNQKLVSLFALLPFSFVRRLMKMELARHLKAPAGAGAEVAARVRLFRDRLSEYLSGQLTKELFLSRMNLFVEFAKDETYRAGDCDAWPGRILIIESTDDPMIGDKERRRLKSTYPKAAVYTFEGTGHLIPLLKLDEMVGVIKGHLSAGSRAAP